MLVDEVKYLKETEGGRGRMCGILEEMCEEVAKETARSLLALGKLSYEDMPGENVESLRLSAFSPFITVIIDILSLLFNFVVSSYAIHQN